MLNGVLNINKPKGITSHDVVDRIRRRFKMRRVGHAGTLDPLATGVLVILLGKSTKLFSRFEACDKGYRATMVFGTRTTTADINGKVVEEKPFDFITREKMMAAIPKFEGEIDQMPPMVSALKHKGKRLYQLARKGIEVEREARRITIHRLELTGFDLPRAEIFLECTKGTYVRKLAEDLAEELGSVACVSRIERTRVGDFRIEDSVTLDEVTEENILNPEEIPI